MKYSKLFGITAITFGLLAGCTAPQTTYHWGQYEQLLYEMYVEPGKATPTIQVEKLTADIQQAEALGKPVPPGVYAHLGFMYALEGNTAAATNAFNTEKALYPDSQILIDGMLKRAAEFNNKS